MKKAGFIFIFLAFFASSVSAQTKEAIPIDEFGRIACGDFMARMDGVYLPWKKSPDSNINVIYYGGRFRKHFEWNRKTRTDDRLKLDYAHRDDGLSWAQSIPLFLTTYKSYSAEDQNLIKDKIVLINGGYKEDIEVEIWLVPNGAEIPKPSPTIDEKYIKFRNDKPYRTPNFTGCYDGY